jgi:predicted CXXCH cytochrome family protein
VKFRILISWALLLLAGGSLHAQLGGDVIGVHNLGPGSNSPITGARTDFCTYCHAPHSGVTASTAPLWNQSLTTQTYTTYTSPTYHQTGNTQPLLGSDSNLCLSCHDGTVAPGTTAVSGSVTMTGSMYTADVFGTNLTSSHPFSLVLPINDAPDLVATLVNGQTGDPTGAIKLVNGNIECTSCHNPHVQAKDAVAQNFLVKDSSKGAMCLACHDPNRVVQGQTNPLAGWFQSIHATATDAVTNLPYPTLDENACVSCHTNHNAPGSQWLLRGAGDQVCLSCHSGSATMTANAALMKATFVTRNNIALPSVMVPSAMSARLNVAAESAKIGHPLSTGNNNAVQVRAQSKGQAQTVVPSPNNPGLSGCTGCHDPHAVQSGTGGSAPAPGLRAAQRSVMGVSEKDGMTLLRPAQTEYQVCLRCHGANTKDDRTVANAFKYGYAPLRLVSIADPMNVIPQFSTSAASSHPVFHPRSSPLPQPSLLANMWNLNGTTEGRPMGVQILCTDCHNSDDNREFGGTGPNGPHGSKWSHILERRYEFSQAPAPGQPITNLFPNPDLSVNGPYALCGKCHNLSNVLQDASFSKHSLHINAGFSCSTCHTAHGTAPSSTNVSGQRLINFDINVVGANGGQPVSYNRNTNTCTLTCHNAAHNPDGSVKMITGGITAPRPGPR